MGDRLVGVRQVLVPRFKMPLSLGPTGSFQVVEQDSVEDVVQCVEALLLTLEGQRLELPDYGIPDPVFSTTLPLAEIQSRIEEWEPRAEILMQERPDLWEELIRRVTVRVEV